MSIQREGGPGSPPPFIDVNLNRLTNAQLDNQDHDYLLTPSSGVSFTFDQPTMASAKITTTGIAPSVIDLSYKASAKQTKLPCTLASGGKSFEQISSGRLSFSSFKFVSGTAPFFGVVTKRPVTATLYYDPGCRVSIGGPNQLPQCGGSETLVAFSPADGTQWIAQNDYGDGFGFQAALAARSTTKRPDQPCDPLRDPGHRSAGSQGLVDRSDGGRSHVRQRLHGRHRHVHVPARPDGQDGVTVRGRVRAAPRLRARGLPRGGSSPREPDDRRSSTRLRCR